MKIKIGILFLISLICLSGISVSAQQNHKKFVIKGKVTDVSDNPVINAVIMIDGEMTNYVTNSQGKYKLRIKSDSGLISVVSFNNGMIVDTLDGREVIDFKFSNYSLNQPSETASSPGDEAINTGYNYIKKRDLTTEISCIDGNNRIFSAYRSITEMIIREVPGVTLIGGALNIQGSRNMFGFVGPMVLVDGQTVNSYDNIPPSSVESITVLKSTAAAIYGTRGFGGVILIKTKSGAYTK